MIGRKNLHVTWCYAFRATKSSWMKVVTEAVAGNKGATKAENKATKIKEMRIEYNSCRFGTIVIMVNRHSEASIKSLQN